MEIYKASSTMSWPARSPRPGLDLVNSHMILLRTCLNTVNFNKNVLHFDFLISNKKMA